MRYLLLLSLLAIFSLVLAENLEVTAKVILDIEIEFSRKGKGKIEIDLYGKTVPKTVNNFIELCKKPVGQGYKGSIFHQVHHNSMIVGGDFTKGDGTGGYSIYGKYFEDENFEIKHDQPGIVSMANIGKDMNGSIFFITLVEKPMCDGKFVAFGKVVKGMDFMKKKISPVKTSYYAKPMNDVIITNCTVVEYSSTK